MLLAEPDIGNNRADLQQMAEVCAEEPGRIAAMAFSLYNVIEIPRFMIWQE
jgi:hypothetical protein